MIEIPDFKTDGEAAAWLQENPTYIKAELDAGAALIEEELASMDRIVAILDEPGAKGAAAMLIAAENQFGGDQLIPGLLQLGILLGLKANSAVH